MNAYVLQALPETHPCGDHHWGLWALAAFATLVVSAVLFGAFNHKGHFMTGAVASLMFWVTTFAAIAVVVLLVMWGIEAGHTQQVYRCR